MMQVKVEVDRLRDWLGDISNGAYFVVGYQKQRRNASALRGKKMVQVFHSGGSFPRDASPMNYATQYEAVATVRLTVSESATVDLSVLNDPNSSEADRVTALGAGMDAEERANNSLDELFSLMFNSIMGGEGEHFGNEGEFTISDRWGHDFRKEPVIKSGSLVVINGYYDIGFTVKEIPDGVTPVEGGIVSGEIDIQDGIDNLLVETGE